MAVTKQHLNSEDVKSLIDKINITSSESGCSSTGYGAIPPITTASGTTYTYSTTPTVTTFGTGTTSNAVWTTAVPGTGINWNHSAVGSVQVKPSATIALKGEDADIDINGKSMKAWMEQVEQRLNILTPNPELEKEWDDLRKLGERYRKLEKKCKEKAEVWKKLKSVPPQTLD